MKELPTPTLPLAQDFLARSSVYLGFMGARQPISQTARRVVPVAAPAQSLVVQWAETTDDVRAAQRLRYEVFAGEMGARLDTSVNAAYPGHDIDLYDSYCEHLLVRDGFTREVVGTYRVLTPAQARRVGSTYTDGEFDLTRLRALRERMVELGRSCVRRDYRHGGVIMSLGGALFEFMQRNRFDTMIGCASIPMALHGKAGGDAAASIWRRVGQTHLAPIEYQVFPRRPLPLEVCDATLDVEPPALIKGYLRLGAKVLSPPAWDPVFRSADLPIMARLEDLPLRYRRHFLGG